MGQWPGPDHPALERWVRMEGTEYRATYCDTALSRPGRRGLARNALAVLREDGLDEETRAIALNDASALVRKQAEL